MIPSFVLRTDSKEQKNRVFSAVCQCGVEPRLFGPADNAIVEGEQPLDYGGRQTLQTQCVPQNISRCNRIV